MRTDLRWRLPVVVVAAVLVAVSAPTALRTIAVAFAWIVVAQPIVMLRRSRGVDALVVAAGGSVLLLIALGFLLDVAPGGLTAASWGIALGIIGVAALLVDRHQPLPVAARRRVGRTGWWFAAGAVVIAGSLVAVTISADRADEQPLQLSVVAVADHNATILVSGHAKSGPLHVVVARRNHGQQLTTYDISVAAGHSVRMVVPLPSTRPVRVLLEVPGTTTPLRSVVVNRREPAGG